MVPRNLFGLPQAILFFSRWHSVPYGEWHLLTEWVSEGLTLRGCINIFNVHHWQSKLRGPLVGHWAPSRWHTSKSRTSGYVTWWLHCKTFIATCRCQGATFGHVSAYILYTKTRNRIQVTPLHWPVTNYNSFKSSSFVCVLPDKTMSDSEPREGYLVKWNAFSSESAEYYAANLILLISSYSNAIKYGFW